MVTSKPRFSCPACAKRFVWTRDFAGRNVRCKCGHAFVAPAEGDIPVAAVAPATIADDAIAPLASPAHAPTSSAQQAHPAVNLPFPVFTGRPVRDMASEDDERSAARDVFVPVALLLVGLGARASQVLLFASQQSLSPTAAAGVLGCELVIGTIALIAGAAAAAGMLGATFGDPRAALLKLAAIAVATSAAAYFAASIDREPWGVRGIALAWHAVLLLYFALFTYLFKLDLQEGMMTTVIVMVIQLALLFAVSRVLSPDAARSLFYG
jgi:hypothetical protein